MSREEAIRNLEALLIRADITDVYGDMEDMTPYEDAVSMAIQALEQDHDGCKDCKHEIKSDGEYPCSYCKQNYKDMWEIER